MIPSASRPIHLDTSFLVRALDPSSPESSSLLDWLAARRPIAVSALAWSEFLCGPLKDDDARLARVLVQRHFPVGIEEASEAARLFNHGGRRRHSLPDCVIAATAILAGAALATSNPGEFERFIRAGLVLAR